MQKQSFTELNLVEPIYRAIKAMKYEEPTSIQAEAIPILLSGKDLIGSAQTGTGKTAAYALPILHKLTVDYKRPKPKEARVLVLTPTRELAAQVGENFRTYGRYLKINHALVFGGVSQWPQVKALSYGVDVLVATPGRLLDLIQQRHVSLSGVEFFVLDEADRMLDMGFLPDIKRIASMVPKKRQALLFSATMASEIQRLAETLLNEPVRISVAPTQITAENIDEKVLFVEDSNKRSLLLEILKNPEVDRTLIFTRTKHGANRLAQHIGYKAQAIHGNKTQAARNAALKDFKTGRCRILVATDVASRGIDVTGVTHVINYDMPNDPESYIHRVGRTARAGASGVALSFCGTSDKLFLREIERLLKRSVPICTDHPYHSADIANSCAARKTVFSGRFNRRGRGNFRRGFGRKAS